MAKQRGLDNVDFKCARLTRASPLSSAAAAPFQPPVCGWHPGSARACRLRACVLLPGPRTSAATRRNCAPALLIPAAPAPWGLRRVMDALKMDFPDNAFDLVWACESGEHMPDKKKCAAVSARAPPRPSPTRRRRPALKTRAALAPRYIEEMTRVLKPGGTLVIACWSQRDEAPERGGPLSEKDKEDLKYLYEVLRPGRHPAPFSRARASLAARRRPPSGPGPVHPPSPSQLVPRRPPS